MNSTATAGAAPTGTDKELPLTERFQQVRQASLTLAEPLSAEDCLVQSMADASPTKWHLAHTSWFFETFVLEDQVGYRHFSPEFRVLYNSYYNTVGQQHARPERGLITRPTLSEVLEYRRHVDQKVLELLQNGQTAQAVAPIVEIGLHHEQQHQELILTDIKHAFFCNPLRPTYKESPEPPHQVMSELSWHSHEEGLRWIGHEGNGWAFDNEGPRHQVFLEAFQIASRPVTNGEFLEFMQDGGYQRPELWLSQGWAVLQSEGWKAPFYWEKMENIWFEFTLSGLRNIRPNSPVCHLSFYEAEAYARWVGARLPSEAEWETAAESLPIQGNFVESGNLHPVALADGAPKEQMAQMFGDVWEWTASPYTTYPGYKPPEGALGEYNAKFASSQIVLRGGSCATPQSHIRPTYRNFFYPKDRWQFMGFRLAKDEE